MLYPVSYSCDGAPATDPGGVISLTSATACVVHSPYETFLSFILMLFGFDGPIDSLSITLSNGANGGEPVVAEASSGGEVEVRSGIPSYGGYDVTEAIARGTDGETVDLTDAIQTALGQLSVTAEPGALGTTPADACD